MTKITSEPQTGDETMTHFIPLKSIEVIATCFVLDWKWQSRVAFGNRVYFRFMSKLTTL